jgi:hypothetical protein
MSADELAAEFAPKIWQDVADGPLNDPDLRRLDLLCAVDFDGDFDAFDSVENARAGDDALHPVVYYDVVETETHAFIVYSLFHPVDWADFGTVDHENDMEQLWLVVEKHADGTNSLRVLHAQAHGELLAWSDDPPGGAYPVEAGGIAYDDGHPTVFVEAHGHGPASCTHAGGLPYTEAIDCDPPSSEDFVIYTPDPDAAPESIPEPDVSNGGLVESTYSLVDAHDVLWPRRAAIDGESSPALWDQPFEYVGGRASEPAFDQIGFDSAALHLGGDFAGDEAGGGGQPPWGYGVHDSFLGGTYYGADGDWLIDPAWLYHAMYRDDRCADLAGFWNYTANPYVDDLRDSSPAPWDGVDRGHRCDGDIARDDTGEFEPEDTARADSDGGDGPDSDPGAHGGHCGCNGGGGGALLLVAAAGWRRRRRVTQR